MQNNSKTNTILLIIIILLLGIIYLLINNKQNLSVQKDETKKEVPEQPIKKEIPVIKDLKQKPTVISIDATNIYRDAPCIPKPNEGCLAMVPLSHATLSGHFDGHGEKTTTWFEYWGLTGLGEKYPKETTAHISQKNFSGNVSENIILPSTMQYQFRLVGQNAEGVTYGNIINFANLPLVQ